MIAAAALQRMAVATARIAAATVLLLAALAFIPGDPMSATVGNAAAGLNASPWNWQGAGFLQRFERLIEAIVGGDFTYSIHYDGVAVADIVLESIFPTLILCFSALATAALPAVVVGLWAAMAGRRAGVMATILFTACLSLPVAGAAVGLVYVLSIAWRLTPTGGWGDFSSAVSPVLALALPTFGHIGRTVWGLAAEAAVLPHVQAARAKGLSRFQTARRHVLRNIAGPLAAFMATVFAHLLNGALLVETLFSIPGLGRETVKATLNRDYPVILGCMLGVLLLNALGGGVAEVCRALSDPRCGAPRYAERGR